MKSRYINGFCHLTFWQTEYIKFIETTKFIHALVGIHKKSSLIKTEY